MNRENRGERTGRERRGVAEDELKAGRSGRVPRWGGLKHEVRGGGDRGGESSGCQWAEKAGDSQQFTFRIF